jgi:hypothetical protein
VPREGDLTRTVEQLQGLAASGIKLRTRALLTTMFARLLLGDLFLHGVGGAKYDQLTDLLMTRFYGVEPPAYMTVTATLRLPIARPDITLDDARMIDHRLRELTFHPERYLDGTRNGNGNLAQLLEQKAKWIATIPSKETARLRCREIRRVNAELQPCVTRSREGLLSERETVTLALRAEAILGSREYAFCLYPADKLRSLLIPGTTAMPEQSD